MLDDDPTGIDEYPFGDGVIIALIKLKSSGLAEKTLRHVPYSLFVYWLTTAIWIILRIELTAYAQMKGLAFSGSVRVQWAVLKQSVLMSKFDSWIDVSVYNVNYKIDCHKQEAEKQRNPD